MAIEDRLRYDKDTTRLLLAYTEGVDPACLVISPYIRVPKTFKYIQYGKGNFLFTDSTIRGIGDRNVKELKIDGGTWTEAFLEEHSLKTMIDRQVHKRSGVVQGLVENDLVKKGKKLKEALMQEMCRSIITKVNAITNNTTIVTKWDDTGGDPVADIKAGIKAFFAQNGHMPTHISIPSLVLLTIGQIIKTVYNVTSADSVRAIIDKILLEDLGIPAGNLLVPGAGTYDTASTNYLQLWSDNVLLFYTRPAPIEEDNIFMATVLSHFLLCPRI